MKSYSIFHLALQSVGNAAQRSLWRDNFFLSVSVFFFFFFGTVDLQDLLQRQLCVNHFELLQAPHHSILQLLWTLVYFTLSCWHAVWIWGCKIIHIQAQLLGIRREMRGCKDALWSLLNIKSRVIHHGVDGAMPVFPPCWCAGNLWSLTTQTHVSDKEWYSLLKWTTK